MMQLRRLLWKLAIFLDIVEAFRGLAFHRGRSSLYQLRSLQRLRPQDWTSIRRPTPVVVDSSSTRREATRMTTIVETAAMAGNVENKYREVMEHVMTHSRTVKKLSAEELAPVQEILLTAQPVIADAPKYSSADRDGMTEQLYAQQELFKTATDMSPRQFDYYARCLSYFADVCAKNRMVEPARVAWIKLRESGHLPIENCLSTYMYVFSLDEHDSGLSLQVAEVHDVLFAPNEKTLTLRIKGLIARGDVDEAERLLQTRLAPPQPTGKLTETGSYDWKRLRTFQPLLAHYCDKRLVGRVLRLFRHMRQSPGVYLESQTYADVIKCLALEKCFFADAAPIETEADLGFASMSGPDLLDSVLTEMADDLLELTEESAIAIVAAFSESVNETTAAADSCYIDTNDLFIKRVLVDNSTAICPDTGVRLKLFALTDHQRKHVRDTLLEMAASQHEEFGQKLKAKGRKYEERDGHYARSKLVEFSDWLSPRQQSEHPYTAFIDGPNVAYYGHGDIHYSQVVNIFEKLVEMGEKPLIIMPEKYTARKFAVPFGGTQELSQEEMSIIQAFFESEQMYAVPLHCLDDYYWMFASVVDHTNPHQRTPLEVTEGRFPGLRPMLVTNDQMRDHKLALLEPREFRRWTGCHIVNYYFSSYDANEWEGRDVQLYPANLFSREIQCNRHPHRQRANVWHIPVAEWSDYERLCLHLTR